jgi:hypothetical protein
VTLSGNFDKSSPAWYQLSIRGRITQKSLR